MINVSDRDLIILKIFNHSLYKDKFKETTTTMLLHIWFTEMLRIQMCDTLWSVEVGGKK
jgi:hypothetical protein